MPRRTLAWRKRRGAGAATVVAGDGGAAGEDDRGGWRGGVRWRCGGVRPPETEKEAAGARVRGAGCGAGQMGRGADAGSPRATVEARGGDVGAGRGPTAW